MEIKVSTNDLVTVTQAAQSLECARVTVYRWIKAGKIVSIEVAGSPYILKTEVERLQKERAAAVTAALSDPRNQPGNHKQEEVKT